MTPQILSPNHERGFYIVWDTDNWRKDRVRACWIINNLRVWLLTDFTTARAYLVLWWLGYHAESIVDNILISVYERGSGTFMQWRCGLLHIELVFMTNRRSVVKGAGTTALCGIWTWFGGPRARNALSGYHRQVFRHTAAWHMRHTVVTSQYMKLPGYYTYIIRSAYCDVKCYKWRPNAQMPWLLKEQICGHTISLV